ncbi:DUF6651 domain-containing protein [Phocoenobacter skyensis]|nr:DUF6651 domain-containing protein [Pasteurella skyensis]MDP8184401.1 hypothetical protein [Pasteurella skyensis]QLB22597.1 hypothetical protein A6B44_05005 [Pasteurella skyensis]
MWKLKLDENGNVVLEDGKPVYLKEDGSEIAFDAFRASAKIAQLNGEAKGHREAKDALEKQLKAFEGITDPEKAKEALQKLGDLDAKKLIDSGEVEKVKAEMAKTYQTQLDEANAEAEKLKQQLYDEKIGGSFARSKFIAENLAIPTDVAQAFFGRHFQIKDGKVVATDGQGNELYSRKPETAGSLADFEESLAILVDSYPNKDSILKSSGMSGAGANPSVGGNGGSQTNLKRSKMSAEEKHKFVEENGHEAFLKLDK